MTSLLSSSKNEYLDQIQEAVAICRTRILKNRGENHRSDERDIQNKMRSIPPDRNIKTNTTYQVAVTRSQRTRGALLDRGANGGLLGDDCRVISKTDRYVNVAGFDNHERSDIRVGTGASYIKTQRGPAIAIWHQYGIIGEGKSVHSCIQLEHYKQKVDDRSMKVIGGTQCIRTRDGYYIPIDIINGLPYIKMRACSDREYSTLPHIVMTSDVPWDPEACDNTITDKNDWYDSITNLEGSVFNSPFDMEGNYKLRTPGNIVPDLSIGGEEDDQTAAEVNILEITDLNTQDRQAYLNREYPQDPILHAWENEDGVYPNDRLIIAQHERKLSEARYNRLKPCFLYASKQKIEKTLENTTQYGKSILSGHTIRNTIKSPFPACNVLRRNEPVATDTVFADVPAVDTGGCTMAQFYIGRKSLVCNLYGMTSEKHFVNTLEDIIRERGAMNKLISDRARVEISDRVHDVLRAMNIDSWQSEPYFQHQNFAERGYRNIKEDIKAVMNATGADEDEWLLVGQYVCYIRNRMSQESLGGKTPLEVLTGSTPDVSIIYQMPYRERVLFLRHEGNYPSEPSEEIGYFVGFSENVGHSHTFKILTEDTRKIIHRSRVRKASELPNKRLKIPAKKEEETSTELTSPGKPKMYIRSISDFYPDRPLATLDFSDLIGKTILPKTPDEDGEKLIEEIIKVHDDHMKGMQRHPDAIRLRVKCGDEEYNKIVDYNEALQFIEEQQPDGDGNYAFKRIIDHEGPFEKGKGNWMGSKYNLLVEYDDGQIQWTKMDNLIPFANSALAAYGKAHNLLDKPGWKRFKRAARRQERMINTIRTNRIQSFHRAPIYMFGVRVPRNHQEAMQLDKLEGSDNWRQSEIKEYNQVQSFGTFQDLGLNAPIPEGHKKIKAHFVFAMKHDGRYKARLVAGGHLTGPPLESVYSGVVSLRSVRLIAFVAELNGLQLWGADISNAYLEAYTSEKVCIEAGPEFGELEGHTLVIKRALYGLKSSGLRWAERFAVVMKEIGFFPSLADNSLWMRDKGDHYEYIGVYVDDLEIASKDPQAIIDTFINKYKFSLKGVGPLSYHLGCDFYRDRHGTLCQSPKKYIERMVDNFKRMFGHAPKQYTSPLEKGDHPEMDTSPELDLDGIKKYQSLIGSAQWAISLGRFDVATAVMTMSAFRAAPREGHLDRVKRIIGYLSKMKQGAIRYRTGRPDLSTLPEPPNDWKNTPYGDAEEFCTTQRTQATRENSGYYSLLRCEPVP